MISIPPAKQSSQIKNYLLGILSSILLFAAAPGQWSIPVLAWISLVPLLIACQNLSWRTAAKIAFINGLLYYLSLIYWIVIALNNYGGLPIWQAVPVLLLLAAYMALYTVAFAVLLTKLKNWPLVFRAPIIWVGLDLIRTYLFSGFPWQDLGYSQYQHPFLIQFADLTGHHGLTFLIVLTNAMLCEIITIKKINSRQIIWSLIILTSAAIYSLTSYNHWQLIAQQSPTINITLVQGNINQTEKWRPGLEEKTIDIYQRLSQSDNDTDILLWPETALPFFPLRNQLINKVISKLRINGPTLITGAPHFEDNRQKRQIFNSAFALTATSKGIKIQRYDKEHLVPFGEYVPLSSLFGNLPLVQSMGSFSAGVEAKLIDVNKAHCGVLICFESIFPDLARKWSKSGANLLLNLTNDAWYGLSSAPWQQVSMATLRAVENRRSLARAANTGFSVFIDPLGHRLTSPLFKEYSARHKMPLIQQKSFFTNFGHLFAPICLLLTLFMGLRRDRKRHIVSG